MALPTTTASSISLSQIQSEFGGSNPISLSEYVRGGTYVPSGIATGTYGTAIPTTNSNLSMKNYYGTQSVFTTTMTVGSFSYFGITQYGYVEEYYFVTGVTGYTAGSLSDYTINTLSGTPTIRKMLYTSAGSALLYVSGNWTSASPNITSVNWVNTTQSTNGTWTTTGTKQYISNWPNTSGFTSFTVTGNLAFSTDTSSPWDVVTFTFNVS